MRQSIRGWRSAAVAQRGAAPNARVTTAAVVQAESPPPAPLVAQQPLRIGLGLVAFVFYLWITHSYKLNAGDIAVLGIGVGAILRGGRLRVPGPLKVFGLFVLWASIGLAVTASTAITTKTLIDLSKVWVISFFVVNLVRTAAELRFAIIAWLGIFALYPIRGALYNQYICRCNEGGRVAWNFIFENPNDLAAFCLIPLGLAAAVASVERVKFWRLCGIVGVAVVSLIIMLTQSRGAMLGIGAAVLLFILTSRRRGRDLAVMGVLMGLAAVLAPRGVWERLAGLTNVSVEDGMQAVDPEGSAKARWAIWQVAFSTIQQKPLMGVGLGMMPETHRWEALRRNYSQYTRGARDTHSTYIRLAAETGIPGLIIYLSIWGVLLVQMRRTRGRIKHVRPREYQALLFIELSLVAYLVASIFGTYGMISFTYLGIATAWLSASVFDREPWYVPPGQGAVIAGQPRVRSG